MILFSFPLFIVIGLGLLADVDASCSRLPSGNCWVNCMMDIFDVICSNVTAKMVQSDLRVFADTSQELRVYIWDSPNINRLSNEVFKSVTNQITQLDFQDLTSLSTFPELKAVRNLNRLNIWNSPLIESIALEQIPPSLQRLSLNKMGVTFLEVDFSELKALANVVTLRLRNMTLHGWQSNFFDTFPNLETLEISNSTFSFQQRSQQFNIKNLKELVLHTNTFMGNDTVKSGILLNLLSSVSFQPSSSLIIENDNVTIDTDLALTIQKKTSLQKIVLRGNPITADAKVIQHWYQSFPDVRLIDLGETAIQPVEGLLGDMPLLQSVLIDRNNITTFAGHRIFQGSRSKMLDYVDLSYNGLTDLPLAGPLVDIADTITRLNLRGNNMQFFNNDTVSDEARSVLKKFISLKSLDLSRNGFSKFYGNRLTLPALETLDLSCNNFTNVTRSFFDGFPKSLTTLYFDFCDPDWPPHFEVGAFAELTNIRTLSIRNGSLRKWIFTVLAKAGNALTELRELYLDENDFAFIRNDTIPEMKNLRVLRLSRNKLQSIPVNAFKNVEKLEELYLSANRITTISTTQFGARTTQLQNLKVLDLSHNGIYSIAPGAFDGLKSLTSLMIGWNHAPLSPNLFGTDSPKFLKYLGVQNYDHGCLPPEFFVNLANLSWLFPDDYNFLSLNPDGNKLKEYDPYLVKTLPTCEGGQVIPDHEFYPGLGNFVSVTIRDADEPTIANSPPYPIMVAFVPLNYCPEDDYIKSVGGLVCGDADVMQSFDDNGASGQSKKS
ncbi:leucine-rich repeat protein soc-2 homolog [Paramacrobiotus metropolitanus]|uniref:leucine-rich repeat protein soc-2 homolog n=1 Tax=Paramacrobiotus metropolitanus TaxID=2943436 RepID=UPI002445C171|nr:leucine-rich repeat protein soc-2 homolog [Paramacrobiotus metropolitanus]